MKYYKDTNGNLYANPTNLDGLVEVTNPVREDGTLLPKHKNLGDIETMEDGSYSTYYNQDGTIDTEKELELVTEEFNRDRKNNGTTYAKADGTEYLVSLTAEDANGLVSAKVGFDMGLVTTTNFVFSNGTIVPISSLDELLHLGAFVVTERNSFFVGVV